MHLHLMKIFKYKKMIISNINKIMENTLIMKQKVGHFGIELYNFDINNKEHLEFLPDLLNEYLVLIIKGNIISNKDQIQLASIFGEITIAHPVVKGNGEHPEILLVDGLKGGKNAKWHTDVSFLENPHATSILVCDEIPEVGGDTLWTDLRSSYQNINETMKPFLNRLEAVHNVTPLAYWGEPFNECSFSMEKMKDIYEESKKMIPVIHPVVRIHPRTYEPCFFVNQGFTSHILSLSQIESDNILKLIYEHTTQPEYILRHKWEKNDIVIWDNICTAHYAINDYYHSRKMRRVTVKGDLPFGFNDIKSRKIEYPLQRFHYSV